jgi:type IV secretion system protein VirB1
MELMGCQDLAVPTDVMHHVVRVESSYNPYAIGVVGGRLARQPNSMAEALATVRMLEEKGYNFSLGLAQVNRYNLAKYGLDSYERAFQTCPNLQAGSRILAECYGRSGGDWGKSFSCYYSGNFVTGFRHGYVQKVYASMRGGRSQPQADTQAPIAVTGQPSRRTVAVTRYPAHSPGGFVVERRAHMASSSPAHVPVPALPVNSLPTSSIGAPPAVAQAVQAQALVANRPQAPAQQPLPSEEPSDAAFVF